MYSISAACAPCTAARINSPHDRGLLATCIQHTSCSPHPWATASACLRSIDTCTAQKEEQRHPNSAHDSHAAPRSPFAGERHQGSLSEQPVAGKDSTASRGRSECPNDGFHRAAGTCSPLLRDSTRVGRFLSMSEHGCMRRSGSSAHTPHAASAHHALGTSIRVASMAASGSIGCESPKCSQHSIVQSSSPLLTTPLGTASGWPDS